MWKFCSFLVLENTFSRCQCRSAFLAREHPAVNRQLVLSIATTNRKSKSVDPTAAFIETSAKCKCLIAGKEDVVFSFCPPDINDPVWNEFDEFFKNFQLFSFSDNPGGRWFRLISKNVVHDWPNVWNNNYDALLTSILFAEATHTLIRISVISTSPFACENRFLTKKISWISKKRKKIAVEKCTKMLKKKNKINSRPSNIFSRFLVSAEKLCNIFNRILNEFRRFFKKFCTMNLSK